MTNENDKPHDEQPATPATPATEQPATTNETKPVESVQHDAPPADAPAQATPPVDAPTLATSASEELAVTFQGVVQGSTTIPKGATIGDALKKLGHAVSKYTLRAADGAAVAYTRVYDAAFGSITAVEKASGG